MLKAAHAFGHRHAGLCDEKIRVHLHKSETHCQLCDFTVGLGVPAVIFFLGEAQFFLTFKTGVNKTSFFTASVIGLSSLRAPPLS